MDLTSWLCLGKSPLLCFSEPLWCQRPGAVSLPTTYSEKKKNLFLNSLGAKEATPRGLLWPESAVRIKLPGIKTSLSIKHKRQKDVDLLRKNGQEWPRASPLAVFGLNNCPSLHCQSLGSAFSLAKNKPIKTRHSIYFFPPSTKNVLTQCPWNTFGEVHFWTLLLSYAVGQRHQPLPWHPGLL